MPRKSTPNVLEVRVSSPRLVWLGFLGFLWSTIKLFIILAVLATAGWLIHSAYHHVVVQNPDFQLRIIDLNDNSVIDERGLVELTNIDLQSNLTELNLDTIRQALLDQPAITTARLERKYPDTLVVRVTTRQPRAWITTQANGPQIERSIGAMLIDADGIPYPCPELQFKAAEALPFIFLKNNPETPIIPGAPLREESLTKCIRLLDHIRKHNPELVDAIDRIDQPAPWSLRATLKSGTEATFGLRQHDRQLARLNAALAHAKSTGRSIATINLIPRENIPITLKSDLPAIPSTPPRAIPVEDPPTTAEVRRDADLNSLLNRQ